MNEWFEKKKLAIVEADDFMDRWDRNGLNFLFYWKSKYPKFKITLFAIPGRTPNGFLDIVKCAGNDWMEFAVHGWEHESNFECYGWDYEKTKALMQRIENTGKYVKIFKAPGWSITPGYNGYPASEKDALYSDPTAVYRALTDMDYIIIDRHYNASVRPQNARIACIDCNPDIVHFHTWNVPSTDPNGRNGFQDVEERFGVPWDNETEFYFISEAWQRGLIKECKKLIPC